MQSLPVLATGLCLAIFASACGASHIRPHTPRNRHYETGEYERAPHAISEGSLWQDSSRGLFADFRANRVGDVVTIRIDEDPRASGEAGTAMDRSTDMSIGVPNFFGFATALADDYPDLDTSSLLNLMGEYHFSGDGETTRGSRVQAAIAVRVKQELPNGDLFMEGSKIIMVNDEELHIYVSGVARPEDIAADNSISSSLVADAQIEFTGRGALTDNQEQGWLAQLLSAINPF